MDVNTGFYTQCWIHFGLHALENAIPEWLGWIPKKSNPIFDLDNLCENWSISVCHLWSVLGKVPYLPLCCAEVKLCQTGFCLRWASTALTLLIRLLTVYSRKQFSMRTYMLSGFPSFPLEYHLPIILWHQIGVNHSHTLYTGKFYSCIS